MTHQNLQKYIQDYWPKLTVPAGVDVDDHLTLPNRFIAPSAELINDFVFHEQFYWDTYFTLLAFDDSADFELKKGMVDNLLFMFDQFGYIPNSNNTWHKGRSQPPVLTLMIKQIFEESQDLEWLDRAYKVAVQEHGKVWLGKKHPHDRLVFDGLSRYYNANKTHQGAEDESGWDYTTRFDDRALDFLPIDLNCLLYAYEMDLCSFAHALDREREAYEWFGAATMRKLRINKLLWNYDDGFFYDYDFVNKSQGKIKSLAAYFAMFTGLADEGQANKLVDNLASFMTDHGLTTTDKSYPPATGKQWSSPNGWAPLHYVVIKGLRNYGYEELATQIAKKWVAIVDGKFQETGMIFEKYNVIDPSQEPTSAVYPDQRGFAWTNAVTDRLIKDFSLNQLPTSGKPVYTHI